MTRSVFGSLCACPTTRSRSPKFVFTSPAQPCHEEKCNFRGRVQFAFVSPCDCRPMALNRHCHGFCRPQCSQSGKQSPAKNNSCNVLLFVVCVAACKSTVKPFERRLSMSFSQASSLSAAIAIALVSYYHKAPCVQFLRSLVQLKPCHIRHRQQHHTTWWLSSCTLRCPTRTSRLQLWWPFLRT